MSALFPPTEPAELERLHARLADDAAREGVLDVAYRTVDSPVGPLLLAATPRGLVRVAFAGEDHERVLTALSEKVSPRILHAPGRLETAARQLEEYFTGARTHFALEVDLALARGFRRTVLEHLATIGYGDTESYAQVAGLVGSPRAVRAVGTACATNPLPIVVPCHRVVRSDGGLGGYLGGLPAKELLLGLERAA
ncbi:methylated-DNA-[protein]-cysteine S-methyltransferase [Georgenia satyanarayanai]|uniref:Methylated-DNA--protein-cysteine methyltransferase n=1 Tax=Georgenia satyanarayanai TaxID=860221 RepID=A0A2Y9C481_9MICO|nr:methylated-DNA--[protein]-cysteine S-methyltransferase [Georgenia satyanarayanai]PYG00924.1 methylated-DNA-[protein]-cysteine S-methyltransferase [Georgenia satyanarayanai]SSA39163.1 methylated-DNA-[protein]-cysteine S-methyltransferase [Georgenia satyanarayanai]